MMAELRLSLVIPVYNEEHHIQACLEAIKTQTVAPYEVIVVDNNSTDKTVEIARSYPFVKVINEKRQGRGWARTAGFNATKGEVIGRIDADSRLAHNWVEHATQAFVLNKHLMGVTGLGRASMLPRTGLIRDTFWTRAYYWVVHATFRTVTMWGADMAIRREAWDAVKNEVCNDDAIVHEDQDISLCMAAQGLKIEQDDKLIITTRGQTFHYFPKIIHYWKLEHSTLRLHQKKGTFDAPKFPRLSFWNTLPGRLYSYVLGVPFLLASLMLLPLDFLMVALGYRKTWLD
jgi:glycosyltransferase involved in cell wall biosynthesis